MAGVTKRFATAPDLRRRRLCLCRIVHPELPPLSQELKEKWQGRRRRCPSRAATVREFNLGLMRDPRALLATPTRLPPRKPALAGQPPVYILNSELDFLRASGETYGEELQIEGVDVTIETEPEHITDT